MKHLGIEIGEEPLLVGVLNVSPESFYKGSIPNSVDSIEVIIEEMSRYGAHCVDIGGMSTRPISMYGGEEASAAIELERIKSYLPSVIDISRSYDMAISVDTQFSSIAAYALSKGVDVINDISGLKTDHQMAPLLADHDVELVVMATKTLPGDPCGMEDTLSALSESLSIAETNGISREKIAVDPGFGGWQGRSTDCDLDLLQEFSQLESLGLPIYVGVSRKSTIGTLGGGELPEERLVGSVILSQHLIDHGAHILRTHDVKETRLGLNVIMNLKKY